MPTAKDPQRGRRPPLNRDRVVAAGVALADAEGIRALTMRRLGGALGVEGMALYNHVRNKDDLLDAMLDRVAGEVELPDDGAGWQDLARRRATSAHAALLRHPWAATLWTSRMRLGPARMRYLDTALRCLRDAGFPPGLLDRAFHTIEDHIFGHALQAQGFPLDDDRMAEEGERVLQAFPAEEYPDLAAHIRYHIQQHEDGDGFEFALDLIIDSLEQMRAAAGRQPGHA